MRGDISFESKCVVYLEARCENTRRSAPATGFFWRTETGVFLVTNRHVVTGRDETNTTLDNGFDPLFLDAYFYSKSGASIDGYTPVDFRKIRIELWQSGKPDWLEHQDPNNFDIVAIDLGNDFDVYAVNDKQQRDDLETEIGADCVIVAFPEGLIGTGFTPIWKRASIASEPFFDWGGRPVFLSDTHSRPGMSGAPVFLKAVGSFGMEGKPRSDSPFFGFWTKFIGIYAGRNGTEKDGYQLGRVWKAHVLSELLENPKKPSSPFSTST